MQNALHAETMTIVCSVKCVSQQMCQRMSPVGFTHLMHPRCQRMSATPSLDELPPTARRATSWSDGLMVAVGQGHPRPPSDTTLFYSRTLSDKNVAI